jgi:hypothetical protein
MKAESQGAEGDLVRRRIDQVLAMNYPWQAPQPAAPTVAELAANIMVYPTGRTLPLAFVQHNWTLDPEHWSLPRCLTNQGIKCEAHLVDLNGDGTEEIVVFDTSGAWNGSVFAPTEGASWRRVGTLARRATCGDVRSALQRGEFSLAPPEWRDIIVGGVRLHIIVSENPASVKCP